MHTHVACVYTQVNGIYFCIEYQFNINASTILHSTPRLPPLLPVLRCSRSFGLVLNSKGCMEFFSFHYSTSYNSIMVLSIFLLFSALIKVFDSVGPNNKKHQTSRREKKVTINIGLWTF